MNGISIGPAESLKKAPLFSAGGRARQSATGQGVVPQISVAYSWIVRSLEKLPEAAMLWITFW